MLRLCFIEHIMNSALFGVNSFAITVQKPVQSCPGQSTWISFISTKAGFALLAFGGVEK
jgi:hypothetical protein